MSLRLRLILMFTLTVVLAVAAVTWVVSRQMERTFAILGDERAKAVSGQFQREFARRAAEIEERLGSLARSEAMQEALQAWNQGGSAGSLTAAEELAGAARLEILTITDDDGRILSSAHWPARFGYVDGWISTRSSPRAQLRQEQFLNATELALVSVHMVPSGGRQYRVAGGVLLGSEFLQNLSFPAEERVWLFREAGKGSPRGNVIGAGGRVDDRTAAPVEALVQQAASSRRELADRVYVSGLGTASVHALPLGALGHTDASAVLVIFSSHEGLKESLGKLRWAAMLVAFGGILFGIVISVWLSGRITRPVEELAEASDRIAAGDLAARVTPDSTDELGRLAHSFNDMASDLQASRERIVQTERVAAWRELARRLAHELKNPLSPLQITVENLVRARQLDASSFDEVFRESTAALRAEIESMKTIVGRFSDFARMPQPQLQPVDMNALIREVASVHRAKLAENPGGGIQVELQLASEGTQIEADPELLRRVLANLLLNAQDAMPRGGTVTCTTRPLDGAVQIEVSDTGSGLTPEECARLFTPYYTTKQHGTGLGLAIVQSVISDHGGKIEVKSSPQQGSAFIITLPRATSAGRGTSA